MTRLLPPVLAPDLQGEREGRVREMKTGRDNEMGRVVRTSTVVLAGLASLGPVPHRPPRVAAIAKATLSFGKRGRQAREEDRRESNVVGGERACRFLERCRRGEGMRGEKR